MSLIGTIKSLFRSKESYFKEVTEETIQRKKFHVSHDEYIQWLKKTIAMLSAMVSEREKTFGRENVPQHWREKLVLLNKKLEEENGK